MNLEQFYTAIKADTHLKAYPIFYDHIDVDQGLEITGSFLVVREVELAPFRADCINYFTAIRYELLSFSPMRDETLRGYIKTFLKDNGIAYDMTPEGFDSDTMMYTDMYTIALNGDVNDV